MIVLGADTHKRSHTIAGVGATTGELVGERTVQVGRAGFDALLAWGRELDAERVWALEDCRHVSGSFERFLIARGERVLRIPTNLMAETRKSSRQRGKSDGIDAVNVARAALRVAQTRTPHRARFGSSRAKTCFASGSRRAAERNGSAATAAPRCSGATPATPIRSASGWGHS